MTAGATLATAPLAVSLFHRISLSGLLNNLWAVPATGVLLGVTSLALALSSLASPLAGIFIGGAGKAADLFLSVLHTAARFSWTTSFYPDTWEMILLYLGVGLVFWIWRMPRRWKTAVPVGVLLVSLAWISHFLPRDLEITFLDVGQGDSALVRTHEGKTLLVDGGGFLIPGKGKPDFDVGEEVVVPFLKRSGVDHLDAVLLSHPHPDHYGGLEAVFRGMPVGEFWWNGQKFPDATFDALLAVVEEKGLPMKILKEGNTFDWNGLGVEVFYPDRINPARNINDNSLVVRLTSGAVKILFTGDIEKEGEKRLSERLIQADILKIPHHASRTSSSIPFMDTVRPSFAVASLGEKNMFGFPHPDILERYERRGTRVFRTDRDGAVTLRVPRDFPRRPISSRTVFSPK